MRKREKDSKASRKMRETFQDKICFYGSFSLRSIKIGKLRDKSTSVAEELLEQQRQEKLLQHEVMAIRQDMKRITVNCTESTSLMDKQFGVTLRFLWAPLILCNLSTLFL